MKVAPEAVTRRLYEATRDGMHEAGYTCEDSIEEIVGTVTKRAELFVRDGRAAVLWSFHRGAEVQGSQLIETADLTGSSLESASFLA
jgi:hypothetical protein